RLAASAVWLYAGRPDTASERAEQALHHTSTAEAWLALARAQVQQQSQLPAQQRSWVRLEKALTVLSEVKGQMDEGWRIDFLEAEYLLAKSKGTANAESETQKVVKILERAEEQFGQHKAFWSQLSLVYQNLKFPEKADRALEEFRKAGATDGQLA